MAPLGPIGHRLSTHDEGVHHARHTVNQMRLRWASGSREAISRTTPRVAYTPKIINW